MAGYMPLIIGLIASCSAFILLGLVDECGIREEGGAGRSDGWRRALRWLGESAPRGFGEVKWVQRCFDEFARSPFVERANARMKASGSGVLLGSAEVRGFLLALDMGCGVTVGILAGSLLGTAAGIAAPWIALATCSARRAREEAKRVEAEMPEAFEALAIALGSGHSLAQGIRFVGSHAQDPVRTEFLRVSFAIDCGVPATTALDDLLERLPAPGLGLVSLALKVSQRTGASLRGLLSEAANMVGERIELARRLDVKTAQARMSARLVALMPIAMIAMLSLVSSDFRAGLATTIGMMSVALALTLNVCAWAIIRHIMEVDAL